MLFRSYLLQELADIQTVNITNNQNVITYLITLKTQNIEFPCRILFNYSFKFHYYKFLENKIENGNTVVEEKNKLHKQIADYDLNLNSYQISEISRHTETIITPEIDFRIFNNVKEKISCVSSTFVSKNNLSSLPLGGDGFYSFDKIIMNNQIFMLNEENQKIKNFIKLANNLNDYDYKRFLNNKSIFIKSDSREDRKSTRLNSSHVSESRMPSSA